MIITVHVSGYYDWEPVPADTKVTEADIKAQRVKPAANGGYSMRVSKKGDTHTTISLPESQVVAAIIDEMTRGDKKAMTRSEAVARYLSRHVMHHHAHKKWMEEVEVSDSGPDEALFRAELQRHVDAGNIDVLDVDSLVAAYLTPATSDSHSDHLHDHFGIEGAAAFKAKRLAGSTPAGV